MVALIFYDIRDYLLFSTSYTKDSPDLTFDFQMGLVRLPSTTRFLLLMEIFQVMEHSLQPIYLGRYDQL